MTTPRPTGLETKAPTALAPGPHSTSTDTGPVAVDPARATVTMVAAVTGTVDEVGDRIIPGAFTRTLRERTPKVCLGHQWTVPIGRIVSIKELLPGDPRLPKRTGSGRPWPSAAGALIAEARLNTAVKEGKDALEMIQFYGPEAAFSIGYRTVKSRQRAGVRELLDLDLFEISPVLHGAHPDARLIGVKSAAPAGLEHKATSSVRRTLFDAVPCSLCGLPAAAALRPVPSALTAFCIPCRDAMVQRGTDAGYLDPADLDALDQLDELTAEQESRPRSARRCRGGWRATAPSSATRTPSRRGAHGDATPGERGVSRD